MTEAQKQTLEKIHELIREHFDAGVVIVETDTEDEKKGEDREIGWHGGITRAVGLCKIAELRFLKCIESYQNDDDGL